MDPIQRLFQTCQSKRDGECPSPEELVSHHELDVAAKYCFPWTIVRDLANPSEHSSTPACIRFICVRWSLSGGDYGLAGAWLKSIDGQSPCDHLLRLESARLHWFLEDYASAYSLLCSVLNAEGIPAVVRLRAQNVMAAAQIEQYCAICLGERSEQDTSFGHHRVTLGTLEKISHEMDETARQAELNNDHECAPWATFDAAVARALLEGNPNVDALIAQVDSIVPNGSPHARRKLGRALATLGFQARADSVLREGLAQANRMYEYNVVTTKLALDIARVGVLCNQAGVDSQAKALLRPIAKNFVLRHQAFLNTPLGQRFQNFCRDRWSQDIFSLANEDPTQDILQMLQKLRGDDMEYLVAKPLLEREFAKVEKMARQEIALDFIVTLPRLDGIRFGVQVKGGNEVIDYGVIAKAVVRCRALGLNGFIAISVRQLHRHAQEAVCDSSIPVLDWTGPKLVEKLRLNADILSHISRRTTN